MSFLGFNSGFQPHLAQNYPQVHTDSEAFPFVPLTIIASAVIYGRIFSWGGEVDYVSADS